MKKHLPAIIFAIAFVAGLSLLLYPTVSDWWNSTRQSRAVVDYNQAVSSMDEDERGALLDTARDYNKKLNSRSSEPFVLSDEELEEYNAVLDVTGTGMMGYIEIPSLNTTLPIYHGTSNAVLAIGVGHIEGSSLPIGGVNTHCVLSGHRGLPGAKLFSNLDLLSEGDEFMIRVLNETLTYEVDQIRIVDPEDISDLLIEKDKDYCTLVTCTPYGINTHRLLVRGHRTENSESAKAVRITSDATQIEPLLAAVFIAIPILIVLFVIMLIRSGRKRR